MQANMGQGKEAALEAEKGHECVEPCYEPCKEAVQSCGPKLERTPKETVTVDVCYGQCDQEEGVDEASFKQPAATSRLQALIVTGHFKCPDVCSRRKTWRGVSSQSECPGDIFLPEVPDNPSRTGFLLDMLHTGR